MAEGFLLPCTPHCLWPLLPHSPRRLLSSPLPSSLWLASGFPPPTILAWTCPCPPLSHAPAPARRAAPPSPPRPSTCAALGNSPHGCRHRTAGLAPPCKHRPYSPPARPEPGAHLLHPCSSLLLISFPACHSRPFLTWSLSPSQAVSSPSPSAGPFQPACPGSWTAPLSWASLSCSCSITFSCHEWGNFPTPAHCNAL